MSRILVDHVWYEQVEPCSFSEHEFEDRIVIHAPLVYPKYHVVPFKKTVTSQYGDTVPDLVFISKIYDLWHVVEVEMSYHSTNHVDLQVQMQADAYYGEEEAQYLLQKYESLDADQVSNLIMNVPPRPLVIVNEFMPKWTERLKKYQAKIATFELFRADNGEEIFRVDGEYPNQIVRHVSQCEPHPFRNDFFHITEPSNLLQPIHGIIKLRFNNCITEWKKHNIDGQMYITPAGRNFLTPNKRYEIVMRQDETLLLRAITS